MKSLRECSCEDGYEDEEDQEEGVVRGGGRVVESEPVLKNLKTGGGERVKDTLKRAIQQMDGVIKGLTNVDPDDISKQASDALASIVEPLINAQRELWKMLRVVTEEVERSGVVVSESEEMSDAESLKILSGLISGQVRYTSSPPAVSVTGKDKLAVVSAIRDGMKTLRRKEPRANTGFQWRHMPGDGSYTVELLPVE